MLLEFRFKNFKSFKDEVTLDLTATANSELSNHVVNISNEKVLPVSVIYGANASGKSNIYSAFKYMSYYVYHSFGFENTALSQGSNETFIAPTPFLFDEESRKQETSFEVFFTRDTEDDDKIYNYGFKIGKEKILGEWLNVKSKSKTCNFNKIIERDDSNNFSMETIPQSQVENIKASMKKNTLIISLGAMLNISICKKIYDWFKSTFAIDFGDYDDASASEDIFKEFLIEHKVKTENIIKFLNSFDDSIIGFNAFYVDSATNGHKTPIVKTIHKLNGTDDSIELPIIQESLGTRKMLSLYLFLDTILKRGGVLFIDELNARLHPLLVRNIIQMFTDNNKNRNHAQLIFTTHDSWQLVNGSLRRDEIWFTDKNELGESELYSLADFQDAKGNKIRNDENYLKNYMLGKYGAIPDMKDFNFFDKDN